MNQTWVYYLPTFIRRKIEGRHHLQQLMGNTGWLFADRIVRMVVSFFVGVWVARYLGPEQFGYLNYAIAFVALFVGLSTLGLDGILVRDIVRHPEKKETILGTAFFLRLFGGMLTFIFSLATLSFLRPQDSLTRWLVGIIAAGTIFQSFDVIDHWFQSQLKAKYTVYAKNIALLIILSLKISLILIRAPLIYFVWANFLEILFYSASLILLYHKNGDYLRKWRFAFQEAKYLLVESWPLIISGTFVLINMQIDKVMLGQIVGESEVGTYSAASRLAEIWYFIPIVVGASITPSLTAEKSRDPLLYQAKLQKVYNFMTSMSLIVGVATSLLSERIIHLIYGAQYSNSAQILTVIIWSALFVFHVSIRSLSFTIEGNQKIIAVYAFFTMLSNVLLNFILIPKHGGLGSAYASLISWMLTVLILPLFSPKTFKSLPMFLKSFTALFAFLNFSNFRGNK